MHAFKKNSNGNYFRKSIVYFLVCAITLNAFMPAVFALEAGNIVNSSGIIGEPTWGDHTVIDTQNGAIINWNNFNTNSSQTVKFQQYDGTNLSSFSAVLNRISSGSVPTQFNGTLNANGRVFIVNPAGIIFGSGSTVNVAQLVASGLNMTNDAFSTVIADENNRMLFNGGRGDTINNGEINAEQSVYLVGENVINNGAIHCPGGLVVMAAGDKLHLGRRSGNVIVNVGADLISGYKDSVTNNGTVGEDRSPVAKLVLAAGDIFSQAITNVVDVAAIARDDIELGDVTAAGMVEAYSGQQSNTSSSLAVNGNITAGGMKLRAGDPASSINRNHHLTVAPNMILHSTAGDAVLSASDNVTLGGDVIADHGGIYAAADTDFLGFGDLITQGLDAPNGDIELKGRDITINNAANAGGDITITALEQTYWGGGTVHAKSTLTTVDGDIEIMVKETWKNGCNEGGETDNYWADGVIILDDDVTAGGTGEITLHNTTQLAAGKMLQMGVTVDPEPSAEPGTGGSNPGQQPDPEPDSQLKSLQQLWQIDAKLSFQTEDESGKAPAAQAALLAAAPIPDDPELQVSGCPALTKWAAKELGINASSTQISFAGSPASAAGIPPCDACAGLKRSAAILRDYSGVHIAALSGVINEHASSVVPLTEEQEAMITVAIADGAENNAEYALAKEYLDALADYVAILNNGINLSAADSTEFVLNKYIEPLIENENTNLAPFLAAKLTTSPGS